MSPALALAIAGALVAVGAVAGVLLRVRDGRRRSGGDLRFDPADSAPSALGARATLVQFSTEMCARCPQTRRMLGAYAAGQDGVDHVEVDLTHRPDLSSRYRVMQTPTTFLVDRGGVVRARFHGVPRRDELAEALAAV